MIQRLRQSWAHVVVLGYAALIACAAVVVGGLPHL
jgi:hypothetical protein